MKSTNSKLYELARELMDIFPFAGAVKTPWKNELEYSQALRMCTDTLGKFEVGWALSHFVIGKF